MEGGLLETRGREGGRELRAPGEPPLAHPAPTAAGVGLTERQVSSRRRAVGLFVLPVPSPVPRVRRRRPVKAQIYWFGEGLKRN